MGERISALGSHAAFEIRVRIEVASAQKDNLHVSYAKGWDLPRRTMSPNIAHGLEMGALLLLRSIWDVSRSSSISPFHLKFQPTISMSSSIDQAPG